MFLLPRKVNEAVTVLGVCTEVYHRGEEFHVPLSVYLITGRDRTMVVDTSTGRNWARIHGQLEQALDGRDLNYVFPTHPEVPHCSGVTSLLNAYPKARVVGDIRDYHLYYPDILHRCERKQEFETLDLGGGVEVEFLPSYIGDLPNTLWAYERSSQTMFVSDGFSFAHQDIEIPGVDDAVHRAGQCAMWSSELVGGVNEDRASLLLQAALYWTQFVEPSRLFEPIAELLRAYPTQFVAPAHGNVIDSLALVLPAIRGSHDIAYGKRAGV